MSLLKKKTAEELKADAERQAVLRREAEARKRAAEEQKERERVEQERRAFEMSPAGRARAAFARKDHVFQQAIIVMMVGGTTTQSTSDPLDILNSVCREGWDLVNGSFVFVEQGQESRDKSMPSGQNVAIKGKTVGYYLFKRFPANRHP
ncbi:hypothetical protein [Amycolatopsis minnesotensis]|uniref:Uncharacterized protein n=1 Tax=Amycolatopsis minnesotensis TaxID=337894 RepID=A0ABP5BDU9_9PSEU